MPSAKEPFCLTGRTGLLAGGANELTRQIVATLSAAGAQVSQPAIDLPLSSDLVAAVEIADILMLATVAEPPGATAIDDWETIDRLRQTQVRLPTALLAKAIPAMRRRRWGRIIFLAGADLGPAAITVRSAQSAFMQAEARQLAADGITVNMIQTPAAFGAAAAECGESVAAAMLYFAGDGSSFVTGQTLQIIATRARLS
jgi:NAD(P)-dependent dehydrogenase (short-subunit alcohol dehydrogenase family)